MTNTKTAEHILRDASGKCYFFMIYTNDAAVIEGRVVAGRSGTPERRYVSQRDLSLDAARAEYKKLLTAGCKVFTL